MGDRAEGAGRQVVRDRAWNEREYGREKWPAVEALVDEALALESPPKLSRVVWHVARREHGREPVSLREQQVVVAGRELRVPQSVALGAYQALIVETVVDACRGGADAVVELGSGWSRNLFLSWLGGAPAEALYVGAELTDPGRRAADRIARSEPRLRFESIPFDYDTPDLGAVAGHARAVVFTVHSVDMAPELDASVFDEVRRVARTVTGVHFENFGWQTPDADARAGDHARGNDYNRNLFALLEAEHAAGRIELVQVVTDVIGFHPGYRTSVAVWRAGG